MAEPAVPRPDGEHDRRSSAATNRAAIPAIESETAEEIAGASLNPARQGGEEGGGESSLAGDPPPRSVHYGAVNEGTAEVGVVGGGVEDDRASVASFASLEDAEETVRARGGAATGTASANNASLKQKPSVFEMFAEIRDGRTRDGTHRSSAPTKAVTIDSEASAITSAPTQQIVLLDGMHRVRTRTASSSSSKAANLFADSNNSIGAAYCDPPPPRSHSHSHHHHEPSMNDLSFLMREQDADLLESIQRKAANDDTNDTPQKQQQQIAAASAAAAAGADSDGIVAAAATSIDAASEALDKDGSALSTIPPPTAEVPRKKPHRIPPAALQVPPIPAPDAGSGTVAPAAAAAPATTPTSSRQRAKPASLRTLLIRHESGDAAGAAPASLVRRSSQASGGGIGIGDGLDDHGSVGTEGTSATVVGERARKALSGEIWVLPEDVPPTASPPISAAVSFGADVPPPPASLDRVPMPSPKRTERSSVSVPAIAEGDETLTVPSFGHDDDDDDADSKKTKDSKSQSSVAAPTAKIVRSESHDRRLNEAAQFAEAVGELQLAEQNELMIIEEDRNDGGDYDFDDDTDDDATEIHVEGVEAGGGSSSSPKRRTVVMGMQGVPVEVSVLHQPHKARPQWPFRTKRTKGGFLDKLPETGTSATQNFVYKGIRANPPEIVSRGVTRGNYSCLHRKAWLECTDKYHRYGKNLRLYYRYWERLGFPTNMFFDWLDSKGEAAGQPLPELEECPRSQLDSDTVLYITDEQETRGYAVQFVVDESGRAIVVDVDSELVRTGPEGWIFVLRDNVMYAAQKITSVKGHCKQRFHHSSFFGGKAVAAAGIFITDDNGGLLQVLPHSGHYRPGEAHMQRMLFFLHNQGVDLWSFQVDMQQILHVARDTDGTEKVEKRKKTETLRLTPAGLVACYLAHKARFIGEGIFSQIHRIKKADVATVSEALELIDDGSTSRTSLKEADMSH